MAYSVNKITHLACMTCSFLPPNQSPPVPMITMTTQGNNNDQQTPAVCQVYPYPYLIYTDNGNSITGDMGKCEMSLIQSYFQKQFD